MFLPSSHKKTAQRTLKRPRVADEKPTRKQHGRIHTSKVESIIPVIGPLRTPSPVSRFASKARAGVGGTPGTIVPTMPMCKACNIPFTHMRDSATLVCTRCSLVGATRVLDPSLIEGRFTTTSSGASKFMSHTHVHGDEDTLKSWALETSTAAHRSPPLPLPRLFTRNRTHTVSKPFFGTHVRAALEEVSRISVQLEKTLGRAIVRDVENLASSIVVLCFLRCCWDKSSPFVEVGAEATAQLAIVRAARTHRPDESEAVINKWVLGDAPSDVHARDEYATTVELFNRAFSVFRSATECPTVPRKYAKVFAAQVEALGVSVTVSSRLIANVNNIVRRANARISDLWLSGKCVMPDDTEDTEENVVTLVQSVAAVMAGAGLFPGVNSLSGRTLYTGVVASIVLTLISTSTQIQDAPHEDHTDLIRSWNQTIVDSLANKYHTARPTTSLTATTQCITNHELPFQNPRLSMLILKEFQKRLAQSTRSVVVPPKSV